MASSYDLTQLDGLFKDVYADSLENLLPGGIVWTKEVNFVERAKRQGDVYNQPVMLKRSHGFTYSNDGGVYTLNDAVSGETKEAQVDASEIVLRDRISYAAASRAASGPNAFMEATEVVVLNMRESFAVRLEVALMYGQSGIGQVDGAPAANVITIGTDEWAAGIWAGAEGMKIQAYDALSGGTVQNTANGGIMTISAVSMSGRTITVDDDAGVADNDYLFYHGSYGNEMAGLHKIITNTGTLFGINAASYSLWSGNTYSASAAALSFNKVSAAINLGMEKGLNEDACLIVNNNGWTDLMQDVAALRTVDESYANASVDFGHQSITFFTANGKITVKSSIYCKEGFAYIVIPRHFKRVGSTDVTFNRPGQSDTFFKDLENESGFELRAYTDQALFCHSPGKQVVITAIVNG
jgi:hypothetical protein